MIIKTLREAFISYAKNENLSAYSPEEFADRMMVAVDYYSEKLIDDKFIIQRTTEAEPLTVRTVEGNR